MVKKLLKYRSLIAFAIGANTALCAQDSLLQPSEQVITESPAYHFQTYFSALFLKPSASNMHYAAEAIPLPLPSPNWQIFDVHPGYHFGFDVGFKAFFHRADSALTANWEHFNSSSCSKHNVGTQNMVGPFFEIGPDAALYSITNGKVKFSFDEFNIDYGQLVHWGHRLHTNLFCGISFARVKQTATTTFSNEDGTIARTIIVPASFGGAGPRFGADFSYDLIKGLQFNGKTTVAILAGTGKNETSYLSTTTVLYDIGVTPPNVQSVKLCSRTLVVPALFQRIGFAYDFTFCDHYDLKIEAGYQAQIYFQALQTVAIGSEVTTPPVLPDTIGVFARTFQRIISNFALSGAYLTFEVGF